MNEDRTHGADSAINVDNGMLTADEIRYTTIKASDEARAAIAALPPSESRDRLLALQEPIRKFWAEEASDDFCRQWLYVALEMAS